MVDVVFAPPTFRLSVVVPVYNEQEVLYEFYRRLVSVKLPPDIELEMVFVNDGSRDATPAILDALHQSDPRVTVINLSRNFGKETATTAGLDWVTADAAVVIDADLQDPPELIPDLIAHWRAGFDVVYAQRRQRLGETWMKKATARTFYRVMQHLGSVRIPENTGDYRLLSRRALDALKRLREQHRFLKGLFTWIGYRQVAVPYDRAPRQAGHTKWNYWRLWNFSIEGITGSTIAPLKVASYVGMATALGAFAMGALTVVKTLIYGEPVAGYPSLMTVMLMLGSVQLVALGVQGEYLGRIFNEVKGRPLYLIDSILDRGRGPSVGEPAAAAPLLHRPAEPPVPVRLRSAS